MKVISKEINKPKVIKYWVAHNSIDIFHFGECSINGSVKTGQPKLESFDTEKELIDRVGVLTGDANYYKNNNPE